MKSWFIMFTLLVCLIVVFGSITSSGCGSQARAAKSATEAFLTYEKFNQWDNVWGMLHPDSQAAWDSKNAFINVLNQPSSNLVRFKIGKAKTVPSWSPQQADTTYSHVVEIPVMLVYSTVYGETERYQMIHTVNIGGSWKFFQYPKK